MTNNIFVKKFKVLNKIGEGSFSEVLKCKNYQSGEYFAAKRLKKRFQKLEDVYNCAEIVAMQKIKKHPHILCMLEYFFDDLSGKVTFIFELMDMSMYDFMKLRKRCVNEPRAKCYLYQILSGLDHLHRNGLFHRDIKPENILIKIPKENEDNYRFEIIKIADLGSIRGIFSRPPYTEYISTRWYRSPECLLTNGYYGPKMDVWATGCVFYEIVTLKPIFPGSNEVDQLTRIHNVLGTPSSRLVTKFKLHKSCYCTEFPKKSGTGLHCHLSNLSNDGQDLMKLMICYDPDARSNVKRLLEHKYFVTIKEKFEKINAELDRTKKYKAARDLKLATQRPNRINKFSYNDVTNRNVFGSTKTIMKNTTLPDMNTFQNVSTVSNLRNKIMNCKSDTLKSYNEIFKRNVQQSSQIPVLNKTKSLIKDNFKKTSSNLVAFNGTITETTKPNNSKQKNNDVHLQSIPEFQTDLFTYGNRMKNARNLPARKRITNRSQWL